MAVFVENFDHLSSVEEELAEWESEMAKLVSFLKLFNQ
jgi:hypothetical protein